MAKSKNSAQGMPAVKPKYPVWLPVQLRKGYGLCRKINQHVSSLLSDAQVRQRQGVQGHITFRQGAVLFYFACTQPGPGRIVEIGSFKGKSTAWLATALQLAKTGEKVLAIDPHLNVKEPGIVPDYPEPSSYHAFLENLSRLNLMSYVEPIRDSSQAVAKNWSQPVKFLFVDGSHLYQDVLTDLRLWEPWLNLAGIICMHDTRKNGSHPGVHRAMNEYIVRTKRFKELLRLGNLAVFRKLSSA